MSLHGTLETFALPDVMALLAATKKTGELRVVGERLDGRVHLDAGKVVAADVGRADSFVDAVFELLRLTTGKFSFDGDRVAEQTSEPAEVEPLLFEAQARLAEWRDIEAVVPSMRHAVSLVLELGDPHVTLGAEQWRMVVAAASATCVHDVADHLGLGEFAVCKSLKALVEAGVLVVAEPIAGASEAPKAEPVAEPAAETPAESAPPAEAPAESAPAAESAPPPEAPAEPVADTAPEPVAEAPAEAKPEARPEPETKPEPTAAKVDGAKVVIEPERKPEAEVGGVDIPALMTKNQTAPVPPAAEPAQAAKKVPVSTGPVSTNQAKQLVSQLAALSSDEKKQEKPAAKAPEATAPEPEGAGALTEVDKVQAPVAEAPSTTEGGDTEEPLNRGLLLKFLSSVRQ